MGKGEESGQVEAVESSILTGAILFWGVAPLGLRAAEMGEQNVTVKTLDQICALLKCRVSEVNELGAAPSGKVHGLPGSPCLRSASF